MSVSGRESGLKQVTIKRLETHSPRHWYRKITSLSAAPPKEGSHNKYARHIEIRMSPAEDPLPTEDVFMVKRILFATIKHRTGEQLLLLSMFNVVK